MCVYQLCYIPKSNEYKISVLRGYKNLDFSKLEEVTPYGQHRWVSRSKNDLYNFVESEVERLISDYQLKIKKLKDRTVSEVKTDGGRKAV